MEGDASPQCLRTPLHGFGDLRQRLDRAHLVVGKHHTHEHGPLGDCSSDVIGIDSAEGIDRKERRLEAKLCEVIAGVQHSMVLDARRDYVVAETG